MRLNGFIRSPRFRVAAVFVARERNFAGDVSHELRTPITIIRGATEVLLADPGRHEKDCQRRFRIERAARDLADVTTALLALAREPDGERCTAVDLAALIEDAVEKHRHLCSVSATSTCVVNSMLAPGLSLTAPWSALSSPTCCATVLPHRARSCPYPARSAAAGR